MRKRQNQSFDIMSKAFVFAECFVFSAEFLNNYLEKLWWIGIATMLVWIGIATMLVWGIFTENNLNKKYISWK